MGQIFQNKVTITAVHNRRGKQFAFGVTHEPTPRNLFFPYWIIKAYEITSLDMGGEFDCLFVDQPEDKHPVVVALLDEDLAPSIVAGDHHGRPGDPDFTAVLHVINRRQ